MRILGLDPGDRAIGVAVSDSFGWTAQALETIIRKDIKADIERIMELIREWEVEKIVMGFPKNMNSTIGPQGEKAVEFAKKLEEATGLEVVLWDERLSTVAAEKLLIEGEVRRNKRKKVIDKVAASIILQGYLDSLGNVR
ncbi:MAG: Holliday junction resolvase RuvX [Bacillota bacterium]|nr:Holliday junction resolvase RuvX [Bacillota bacterium]MDD3297620.1 Holliday junction resolvase RuvX [Bacillota bacterium]MDD3851432.1 Holliday junction resolvase RuvX [Bacillota bacterium]MDD4707471.1 Holliday junction resolvase RuvX [Bacillota bacterium]